MSDRVENMLIVLGPMADREQFQAKARGKMVNYTGERDEPWQVQPLCFNNFVPVPDQLLALPRWGECESWADGAPKNCGGEWEQQHWGCKCGPIKMGLPGAPDEGYSLPDVLMYYFDTINAVPVQAFRAISAQWPTLRFELFWQAEWETYDPTHLCVFLVGEWVEHRTTTVNMYYFQPEKKGTAKAEEEGYYTDWTEFRNDVAADWLPEWSDVRAEVEHARSEEATNTDE